MSITACSSQMTNLFCPISASIYKITTSFAGTEILLFTLASTASKTDLTNQSHYIEARLEQFGLSECSSVKTSLPQKIKLSTPSIDKSLENKQYWAAFGILNFLLVQTRPNIALSVSYLTRFNPQRNDTHWAAARTFSMMSNTPYPFASYLKLTKLTIH